MVTNFSLLVFALVPVAAAANLVTVTPWCDNSFRVSIAPDAPIPPPSGITPGLPGALTDAHCVPGRARTLTLASPSATNGNLKVTLDASSGALSFSNAATGAELFHSSQVKFATSTAVPGLASALLSVAPGDKNERLFGLGQGNWSRGNGGTGGGCASRGNSSTNTEHVVPLKRNGQTVDLMQRKFHISIPWLYSTSGYGLLFNHGGYGSVTVGDEGVGGHTWSAQAVLDLDLWVTGLPGHGGGAAETTQQTASSAEPIFSQYADATGHAPPLRDDAQLFWQSRNRYKSSRIALAVAERYKALGLSAFVGALVIDYKNQDHDGDFAPGKACYPDVKALAAGIRELVNASTVFSFWPEVMKESTEYEALGTYSHSLALFSSLSAFN
jgi:alpha-D-xyloside xylohydrolase